MNLLKKTVEEHQELLTDREAAHFQALLSGSLSKGKASTLLDYLLGKSMKHPLTGAWEKVTQGIIAQRRTTGKAA